jgi:hypothetical protein
VLGGGPMTASSTHMLEVLSINAPSGETPNGDLLFPSKTILSWLWSLIIFLIQRSLFSIVFITHEDFTPQKNAHSSRQGSVGGVTLPAGSGGK